MRKYREIQGELKNIGKYMEYRATGSPEVCGIPVMLYGGVSLNANNDLFGHP